jgi:hypothetical protein
MVTIGDRKFNSVSEALPHITDRTPVVLDVTSQLELDCNVALRKALCRKLVIAQYKSPSTLSGR